MIGLTPPSFLQSAAPKRIPCERILLARRLARQVHYMLRPETIKTTSGTLRKWTDYRWSARVLCLLPTSWTPLKVEATVHAARQFTANLPLDQELDFRKTVSEETNRVLKAVRQYIPEIFRLCTLATLTRLLSGLQILRYYQQVYSRATLRPSTFLPCHSPFDPATEVWVPSGVDIRNWSGHWFSGATTKPEEVS